MNKKGKSENGWILWVVGAVLVASAMGWISFSASPTGTSDKPVVVEGLNVDSTTLHISASDMFSPTTVLNGAKHALYVKSDGPYVSRGNITNGGTASVGPTQAVKVYFARDTEFTSSDGTAASFYYVKPLVVPPYDPATEATRDYKRNTGNIDLSAELVKAGNLSFTYYNDDGDSNTAQAMGANDLATVSIKLEAANKAGWGNPLVSQCSGKNVIAFEYNSTVLKRPQPDGLSTVACPKSITDVISGNVVNDTMACFSLPIMKDNVGGRKDVMEISIDLESKDTQPVSANESIGVYTEDCDMDINQDTGAEIFGVEDEDQNDIGSALAKLGSIVLS